MKKLVLISVMLAASLTILAQKGKWKNAKEENSIESYQTFIEKYPNSEFTSSAKSNLLELEFEESKRINTIKAYKDFLTKYPNSLHSNDARERMIKLQIEEELVERERILVQEVLSMGSNNRFIIPEIKGNAYDSKNSLSIIQIKNEKVNEIRFISDLPNDIGISTIYQENFLASGGKSYSLYQLNLKTGRTSAKSGGDLKGKLPKLPMGNGSVHRFKTAVYFDDIGLPESSMSKINVYGSDPVAFLVTDKGYVFLYGKGDIIYKDGRTAVIGSELSKVITEKNNSISLADKTNIKQNFDVVKEVLVKNGFPINATDSPEILVIAGDKKREIYRATSLGKYIMIEKKIPFASRVSTRTIFLAKPVDEEIIKDITERLDCEVFDADLYRKFILTSDDYPINLIPEDELELSYIGRALFQLNEYKAAIDYLEQAIKIKDYGISQQFYPYLAAAYSLTANDNEAKIILNQMLIECQKSRGYLSYANSRKSLLDNLQKVLKSIPEDEREYWDEIVLKIENI